MKPSIALVGRMGAGKSTIAEHLADHYRYSRHSWAAPVRAIFAMAYGSAVLEPRLYAETKARTFVVTGPDGYAIDRTGRELLQRIGTDAIRDQVDRDFWIKAGLRAAVDQLGPFVNDDTRFQNEADAVRRLGWLVVRLERPGLPDTGTHPSETEQAAIRPDLVVVNDGPPWQVAEELIRLVEAAR